MHPRYRIVSLVVLTLAVVSCGGGNSTTPTLPTRTVVTQGQFSGVPSSSGGSTNTVAATRTFAFTVTAAGTIDAAVDWTSASNQVGLAIYPANCVAGQLGFGQCNPLAQGPATTKPSRVTLINAAAGTYTLAIINLGPGTESGTYEIGLTR